MFTSWYYSKNVNNAISNLSKRKVRRVIHKAIFHTKHSTLHSTIISCIALHYIKDRYVSWFIERRLFKATTYEKCKQNFSCESWRDRLKEPIKQPRWKGDINMGLKETRYVNWINSSQNRDTLVISCEHVNAPGGCNKRTNISCLPLDYQRLNGSLFTRVCISFSHTESDTTICTNYEEERGDFRSDYATISN